MGSLLRDLILRLMLFCVVAQDYTRSCDVECQNAIIEKIKTLLDSELNPIRNKLTSLSNEIAEMKQEREDWTVKIINKTNSDNNKVQDQIHEIQIKTNEYDDLILNTLAMTDQNYRCEGGIFLSTQCFIIYMDQKTNWTDAEELCKANDLVLAEPSDSIAGVLRRLLLERYGEGEFWINGKGTGSQFMWQRSSRILGDDHKLWSPGQPGDQVTTSHCLTMEVQEEHWWNTSPGQLYHTQDCGDIQYYPLCERLLENDNSQKSLLLNFNTFKIYKDQPRTWSEAKAKCESEGLRLAEPSDSIAPALRKHLLHNYGNGYTWLGAKETSDSSWRWLSGSSLDDSSPLWYDIAYKGGRKCLLMLVNDSSWKAQPEKPYAAFRHCEYSEDTYALCQVRPSGVVNPSGIQGYTGGIRGGMESRNTPTPWPSRRYTNY